MTAEARLLEIERKARVDDPQALERRLLALGTPAGEATKEDRYYLLSHVRGNPIDLASAPIFRVRLTGGRAVLGYKSRTLVGPTEVNEEREMEVPDAELFIDWLESYLGLAPFVTKRKHTRLYRLTGRLSAANVELNEVEGLGHFVEVEVMAPAGGTGAALAIIDEIFDLIGIPESAVEPRYYIDMLMALGKGHGS